LTLLQIHQGVNYYIFIVNCKTACGTLKTSHKKKVNNN